MLMMGYLDKNGKSRVKTISVSEALCIVANGNFHLERIVGSNMDILINEDGTKWFNIESFH